MHPAVQYGGEVEICTHDFHLTETPQNAYIADVHEARRKRAYAMALDVDGRVYGDTDRIKEFGDMHPHPSWIDPREAREIERHDTEHDRRSPETPGSK